MIDLEKTMKGLECCNDDIMCPDECPYKDIFDLDGDCREELVHDALGLLKIHYPRVMGITEITEGHNALKEGCVWLETKFGALAPVFVQFPYKGKIRMYSPYYHPAKDTEINETWWPIENYKKIWRCWTFRPTDKQREETPWEK